MPAKPTSDAAAAPTGAAAAKRRPRRKPRRAQLGVTIEDYNVRLAHQRGGCAICGNTPKTRRLDTDHDHRTGEVRGLLCARCNRALPNWVTATWLENAARYLRDGWVLLRDGEQTGTTGPVRATNRQRCVYCGHTALSGETACAAHLPLISADREAAGVEA